MNERQSPARLSAHGIDPSFRQRKQQLARSRLRRNWLRGLAAFGFLCAVAAGVGYWFTADQWSFEEYDGDLEMTEDADIVPEDAGVYVPAIVDLAGDPMWLSVAQDPSGPNRLRAIDKPAELTQAGISQRIDVLSDAMISSSERFMTTIPSTQEDFAFFQAQRAVASVPASPASFEAPSESDLDADLAPVEPLDEEAAGWGETISAGEAELPAFKKTEVENNTSVAVVTPETERIVSTEDFFVKVLAGRTLDSVVLEERFPAEDAKAAGEALKSVFQRDTLEPGYVVAMRGFRARRGSPALSLMQVSIYANDTFIGTLARNAAGAFVSSADPWVRDDLFNYSGEPKETVPRRQYRLLDAIYSTAARNNVPTAVIGEAIMYLSRGQDLNAFAANDDRLLLVYSDTGRGRDGVGGRVLYVGVQGKDRTIECFVFEQGDGDYACVSGDDQVRSLSAANGMVTPVSGVMTSTFGPRKHPILGTVRIHKGVDWAAPVGTPISAAFDGEIVFQGNGGDYGNLVRIAHEGGRETRYAHMQRFAIASGVGTKVKAGDVIGYIGTTGLSTGPHLHFELYQAGQAIDPLGTVTIASAPSSSSSSDDAAVETLTDRIVHVESGGNARAKNPLSSATGLGQFIESTWIRMMNTYRPDLARSLSRADLLALRFDPTISREMVRNLAREGEAYLRARGHQITAGRLYLCHFLGMDGAHQVLSASSDSYLVDVLGNGVIRANPFLTGKTVAYVVTWAENKMNRRGRAAPTAPSGPVSAPVVVRQTSPEFEQYKTALAAIVGSLANAL